MYFELLGKITQTELMAKGPGIDRLAMLVEAHGNAAWRKLKGVGKVRLPDGTVARAEIHWYEAHGIGRRRMKIKRVLE